MSTHDDPDYEVGYGKPPHSTQFKKGQSGNSKGRPKGAKGFSANLKREMESTVTVREGNRQLRMSKGEAMAKRLVEKALKGETAVLKILMQFDANLNEQDEREAEQSAGSKEPDQTDYAIIEHLLAMQTNGVVEPEDKGEDE